MENMDNKFSLDDLNELSPSLGDKICSLLDGVDNCFRLQKAKEEIERLLKQQKLTI